MSMRKAGLLAALIDAYVDRLFAADESKDDIIAFRAALAEGSPALADVMALCSQRAGVTLAVEAVAVPLADYAALSVEDFMVSLYNDHSVQRLRLVQADGTRRDALVVLGDAIAALDAS